MRLWELLPSNAHQQSEGMLRVGLCLALGSGSELRHVLSSLGSAAVAMQTIDSTQLALPFQPEIWKRMVRKEWALCTELDISSVSPGHPHWPTCLDTAPRPPPFLLVRGLWPLPQGPRLALVGSRHTTEYGRRNAVRLASRWAEMGGIVVSGGAAGIDAASHEGCLDASGYTLAVLGTGLRSPYPSAHKGLFQRVMLQGALVSEYPSQLPDAPYRFPERNRLLTALSDAVAVVQCREKSGALHTARFAQKAGKPLLAIPGPIDDPCCAGSNRLLAQGAQLLNGVSELEALYTRLLGSKGQQDDLRREANLHAPVGLSLSLLDPPAQKVLSALAEGRSHMDDLSVALNVSPAFLCAALLQCELRGWVTREEGNRYRLRVNLAR